MLKPPNVDQISKIMGLIIARRNTRQRSNKNMLKYSNKEALKDLVIGLIITLLTSLFYAACCYAGRRWGTPE